MAKKKARKRIQGSSAVPATELRAFVDDFPEPPPGLDHLDPYGRDLRTHWADFLDESIAKDPDRSAQSVYNALKNHHMLIYMAWVAGMDIVDAYNKYYCAQDVERNRLVSLVRAALPWEAVQAGLTKAAEDGEFTLLEVVLEDTE